MNHVRTNEEYRFFKGRKKSMISDWDRTNAPLNKRDTDEPFFNKNKPAYLRKKRDEEVLKELGIPTDNWNSFLRKLSKRFHIGTDALWSERGTKGVDSGSYYYRVGLEYDDDGSYDSTIYLFPKEKKIVVIYYSYVGNGSKPTKNKKIFEYDSYSVVKVLNDVIDYLFTLKKDPEEQKKTWQEDYDQQKQKKYKQLLSDELEEPEPDEEINQGVPEEIPSHRLVDRNAQNTATFDSLNHVQSFQMFDGSNASFKSKII